MTFFPSYNFFFKYFVRKNWRGEGESVLKNGAIDGYAYLHVFSGPDLHCARSLALKGFLQHLPDKCK